MLGKELGNGARLVVLEGLHQRNLDVGQLRKRDPEALTNLRHVDWFGDVAPQHASVDLDCAVNVAGSHANVLDALEVQSEFAGLG